MREPISNMTVLQRVAVCCSVFQCVSVIFIDGHAGQVRKPISDMTVLQCVAVCCSVQCVAVCCMCVACVEVC